MPLIGTRIGKSKPWEKVKLGLTFQEWVIRILQALRVAKLTSVISVIHEPEFADMTIVCGDGERLPAHQIIICEYHHHFTGMTPVLIAMEGARSEFLYKAMTTAMKERTDKTIHLPEPSYVVRTLLIYLYSGNYPGKPPFWSKVSNKPTLFELHTRVAAMAERLLLQDLKAKAVSQQDQKVKNTANWSAELFSMTVKLFYDEGTTLEPSSEVTRTAKRRFLAEIVARKCFGAKNELRGGGDIFVQYSTFLTDLILQYEATAA